MQEYMESYKLQYIYAPIMYVLLGMAVRTYDVARVIAGVSLLSFPCFFISCSCFCDRRGDISLLTLSRCIRPVCSGEARYALINVSTPNRQPTDAKLLQVFFFFTRIGLPLIMGYPIQHVLGAFFVSEYISPLPLPPPT